MAEQARLKAVKRFRACLAGALCGLAVGGASFLGFHELITLTGTNTNVIPPEVLSAMVGGNLGFVGGAIGFGLVDASMPNESYPHTVALDERSREVLQAARDLAKQMKAMSVPMIFWSTKRLRDFVARYVAFAALERVLLLSEIEEGSEYGKALRLTGMRESLKDLDWSQDDTEMKLKLIKERALRELRRVELETLQYMQRNLEDLNSPFLKIDYEKLSIDRCFAILRYLMSDGLGAGPEGF